MKRQDKPAGLTDEEWKALQSIPSSSWVRYVLLSAPPLHTIIGISLVGVITGSVCRNLFLGLFAALILVIIFRTIDWTGQRKVARQLGLL
jgi:hypothetical protein